MPLAPPTQFDHPYDGTTVETALPSERVDARCREMTGLQGEQGRLVGCAHRDDSAKTCTIVYSTDWPRARWQEIRRFEVAHCNGMPNDHARCALCRRMSR